MTREGPDYQSMWGVPMENQEEIVSSSNWSLGDGDWSYSEDPDLFSSSGTSI